VAAVHSDSREFVQPRIRIAVHGKTEIELDPPTTTVVCRIHLRATNRPTLLQMQEKLNFVEDAVYLKVVLYNRGSRRVAPLWRFFRQAAVYKLDGIQASKPLGLDEAIAVSGAVEHAVSFTWPGSPMLVVPTIPIRRRHVLSKSVVHQWQGIAAH